MFCTEPQAASAAPRRKLSIRRATIETRAPLVGPTNNLKTRSRSFSDLADIFGAEAREHWLSPLQVWTLKISGDPLSCKVQSP